MATWASWSTSDDEAMNSAAADEPLQISPLTGTAEVEAVAPADCRGCEPGSVDLTIRIDSPHFGEGGVAVVCLSRPEVVQLLTELTSVLAPTTAG